VNDVENEEIINIESLKNLLNWKTENLNKRKQRFDYYISIVKEIDNKEGEFLELLQKLENLNKKMILYFDESDAYYKEIQTIEENIKNIRSKYEQKELYLKEEIAKTAFNDEILDKYHKDLCSFLDAEIESVKNMMKYQKKILDESASKIMDDLTVTYRLISTLIKRVENFLRKGELKEFLTLKQKQIENIKTWLPSKVEDFEEIYKKTDSFKGLYKRIRNCISLLKEELRIFTIENKLIEEDEIVVLETIYRLGKREFEFNEITELLKGKIPAMDYEKAQNILLSLSNKGFLTLKLITE
jgi:hypothetical protein